MSRKKLFPRLTLAVAVCTLFSVCAILTVSADSNTPITIQQLPATAQTFLKTHFKNKKVLLVTKERDFTKVTYDVTCSDGTKMEFNNNGQWNEVDCRRSAVPAAIVPQTIATFVTAHYPDTHICKIESDHKEYEVKLANKLELKFDKKFRLLEVDD